MKISILLCLYLGYAASFEVYWNVPTQQCRRYEIDFVGLLEKHGVIINTGDNFRGDKISIFYDTQLGMFPKLENNYTTPKNGGIPQKIDMKKHLEKAELDLAVLKEDFHGPAIIDWEAWRPAWGFNFGDLRAYQEASVRYAKERYPKAKNLTDIAKQEWDASAKTYFLETLRLGKNKRPQAVWGFWGFPPCYNHQGSKWSDFECSKSTKEGNDGLSWLYEESTALFPHIYVDKDYLTRYTFEQRSWKADQALREALRVASPKSKIYPYLNYYYDFFHPPEEIKRQIAQIAAAGSDGAIIWGGMGDVGNKDNCFKLRDLITSTIGPTSEKVAGRSDLCSEEICNGRGRCHFPNDDQVQKWKLFLSDDENFYAGEVTCRCSGSYSGRFCENSIQ